MHPKIVEFVETWPGRVVLTALFLAVAWTFPPLKGFPQLLLIAFLSLAPVSKGLKLLVAAIFCFVIIGFAGLIPFLTNQEQIRLAVGSLDELAFPRNAAYRAIVVILVIGLSAGLNEILWGRRAPLIKLICAWALLLAFGIALSPQSAIYVYLWGAISTFSIIVFPAAYMHLGPSEDKPPWTARLFFPLQELMFMFRFPVIRGVKLLEGGGRRDDTITQIKALKLIIWSRLLYALYNWLNFGVFGLTSLDVPEFLKDWTLNLPNYSRLGFAAYNSLFPSSLTSWTVMVTNAVVFPLLTAIFSGITIALVRLAGVYVPRAVYRPYLAQSFNDYYRRILFYYSEVLVNLFYYPAYQWLSNKSTGDTDRKRLKQGLALFFAIFVGGFIYHVIRESVFFMLYGSKAAVYFFAMLPFFAIIAIVCCISASGVIRHYFGKFLPWPLSLILIFIFHAFLITMMSHSPEDTFHDRFQLWRNLFP